MPRILEDGGNYIVIAVRTALDVEVIELWTSSDTTRYRSVYFGHDGCGQQACAGLATRGWTLSLPPGGSLRDLAMQEAREIERQERRWGGRLAEYPPEMRRRVRRKA